MTESIEVKCPKCTYKTNLTIGTPTLTQTYSDLNEDFSNYKVYECTACKKLFSMNIADKNFNYKCPKCSNKMNELNEIKKCPKCNGNLNISVTLQ